MLLVVVVNVIHSLGDQEVACTSALSGANWNYVLIYEMFAPLRNQMMFTPWDLTTTEVLACSVNPRLLLSPRLAALLTALFNHSLPLNPRLLWQWAKYTKAAVDCHVKDSNEVGEQGQTVYSTAETYAIMMDPKVGSPTALPPDLPPSATFLATYLSHINLCY